MKKFALLSLALGAFGALPVAARPYHITPISWIVATRNNINVDDRYVTIVGHVTRRIGDEEYWFDDNTGSVRLDSENFDLPVGPRLVIGGRIDQAYLGIGHIEVDVRRWHYAPVRHAVVVRVAPVTRAASPTPPQASAPVTTSAPVAPPAQTPAATPPAASSLAPAPEPAATSAPATTASTPTQTNASTPPPSGQ
jgi:hypothetical protein